MSRFYDITISASGASQGARFTNLTNGAADPYAPMVELDMQVWQYHTPSGNSLVRIWGVSLQTISQASDFNGAGITVKGGMQAGLPLATAQAAQAGILCQGTVLMAYGNWQGVNQSLDLVIIPGPGATQANPANIVLNWKKGDTLATALQTTLGTAFPDYTLNIDISDNLVQGQDEPGYFQTLEQLGAYLNAMSEKLLNPDGTATYTGVVITQDQMTINVTDGSTTATDAIQLNAPDFIGQPTWLGSNQISWNMVMRADVQVTSKVKFPEVLTLQTQTTPQSQALARSRTSFQGEWTVTYVRHVGNSRGPSADDWVTNFQAFSSEAPAISVSPNATAL